MPPYLLSLTSILSTHVLIEATENPGGAAKAKEGGVAKDEKEDSMGG